MKNKFPINKILNFLKAHNTFILLESVLCDRENYLSYIFTNPIKIIRCFELKNIKSSFNELQKASEEGYYLAGFLSYEAGYAFIKDHYLKQHYNFPLLWMGVFEKPVIFNHQKNIFNNRKFVKNIEKEELISENNYKIQNLKLNLNRRQYISNIKKIKHLIETGDTYQVNYTLKYKFKLSGCPLSLYENLRHNQQVSYGAFIKTPELKILSFSPELFFRQNNRNISVRPMKGTTQRGVNLENDIQNKNELKKDTKNRAENIMIVDLLRNDLGKISKTGSVKVERLFSIEQYKTLFQMTSTVKGKLEKDITLTQLISSLFPSGSVTGAPKIRTMQIIEKLEKEYRKIYTGAIGFVSPQNKKSIFNVAIRTILLQNNKAEMGIGSGITYSSNSALEYEECKLKAQFLTQPQFQLLETIRWSKKEGFFLLNLHLRRLKASARFFKFIYSEKPIKLHLNKIIRDFDAKENYKIRLLLSKNGVLNTKIEKIENRKVFSKYKIAFSRSKINSKNIFLYHKTTNRCLYDKEYKKYNNQGFFDVIFRNEKNEITEGAISNIFINKEGVLYTPAVNCGLLPGVFRHYLIHNSRRKIIEKVLKIEDLKNAEEIYLSNSVRGLVKVQLATG